MTTKAIIAGGGSRAKAVTLRDLDNFLEYLISDGDNGTEPQDLYKAVAWVFWCANRRANAVAGMPYLVYPMEVEKDEPDAEVEWGIDLRQTLWAVEAWLCLKGAAYVHKRMEGATLDRLQVLNANTMRVLSYDEDGPTVFEQKVGSVTRLFSADEIVYFRLWNPKDDIKEGVSPGEAGQTPGELIYNVNQWATSFFENGAIPAVLLTTEGAVPPLEKDRVESKWNKMFQGVRQAFKTAVLERGLTPTVIGQTNADLAMPDLEKAKKEQILAAYLLPPGLGEAKTNRAERDALKAEAYEECYIPECEIWLEPVLNEQLFNPLGLRLSFQYNEVEVLQARELEKAESMAFSISGVILPAYKENTVSVDEVRSWIDSVGQAANLPPLDDTFEPEERTPPPMLAAEEGEDTEGAPTPADERIESRTGGGKANPPKVVAPEWGRHRVSLQN